MKIADFLSRFDAVMEDREGYVARCPAHGDSRPSLRIWVGDDNKIRLKCRAGCETADVLKAVQLPWAALFDADTEGAVTVSSVRSSLVSTAHQAQLALYVDRTSAALSADALAYAQRRFGVTEDEAQELSLGTDDCNGYGFKYVGRTYRQHPRLTVPFHDFKGIPRALQGRDISGQCDMRWVSLTNPEGHHWAPFGVFRPDSETVFITEGPGDGLAVAAAGYGAVVIRGASLASNTELVASIAVELRDRRVVVAGDKDRAGEGFARSLSALRTMGLDSVERITLRRGTKDVAEWQEKHPTEFRENLASALKIAKPMMTKTNKARDKRMAKFAAAMLGEM